MSAAARPEPASTTLPFETFARQRAVGALGPPASPALASAWAEAIEAYWAHARAVTGARQLRVVDLHPADGIFARRLRKALHARLGLRGEAGQLRYLACRPQPLHAAGTSLAAGTEEGIETVAWDPAGRRVPVDAGLDDAGSSGVATVAIAHGFLGAHPGLLRGVHEGAWLHGGVRIVDDVAGAPEYLWQRLDGDDPEVPELLRGRYLRVLGSACATVPVAGLRAFAHLRACSGGRLLWLAADPGVADERWIRLGALSPPQEPAVAAETLPVNFHALSHLWSRGGAWCHHHQLHDAGLLVQAVLLDAEAGESVRARVRRAVESFHPDDAHAIETLAAMLPVDAPPYLRMTLLRLSGHDPATIAPALPAWSAQSPELGERELEHWCATLQRVVAATPADVGHAGTRHDLGVLLARWGRPGIAARLFEANGEPFCAALCESVTGASARALQRLDAGRAEAVGDDLHARLSARMRRWQALSWYRPQAARDAELVLEPLDAGHADAFHVQYRDPQIGILARLPELDSAAAVEAWIEDQARAPGRASYAVMHAELGFVGVVSMQRHRDAAYFYFWIGCDHQGRGFGQRAGRLLCAQAGLGGVRRLYTSVYADNLRSHDALRALGFEDLDIRAEPPDADLVFMMRGAQGADSRGLHAGLVRLCRAIDSPIRLVRPASPVPHQERTHGC